MVPVQKMHKLDLKEYLQNVQYFTMVPVQVLMWFLAVIPNLHIEKYPQDIEGDSAVWVVRFLDEQISLQQFLTFRWQVAEEGPIDTVLD